MILDDQCDITWVVPAGVQPNPLLETTSFAVDRGDIDLIGGPGGKEFRFLVQLCVVASSLARLGTVLTTGYLPFDHIVVHSWYQIFILCLYR